MRLRANVISQRKSCRVVLVRLCEMARWRREAGLGYWPSILDLSVGDVCGRCARWRRLGCSRFATEVQRVCNGTNGAEMPFATLQRILGVGHFALAK